MATPEYMNYYIKLVNDSLKYNSIKKEKKEEIKKNIKKELYDFEIITKEDILKSK